MEDKEARRLAIEAKEEIIAHERRCLAMWSGFSVILIAAIVGWVLTR
jgi:hypothetical protein